MAIPREQIVDPHEPGVYHCISRCVRHAFLMGPEHDHRREWLEQRLEFLCSIFAVDDASHSPMSNHLHVTARLDPPRVQEWSEEEVVRRWGRLHPKSVLERGGVRLRRGAAPPAELPDDVVGIVASDHHQVEEYRQRLASLSWFMKSLKEPLARLANAEDGVTGAFWEGRFKSIRVLDLAGLLTCMVYVDLNPVHAGMAEGIADSMYTSARHRLEALRAFVKSQVLRTALPDADVAELQRMLESEELPETAESNWMAPIGGQGEGARRPLLHMRPVDYIAIVETAGRVRDPRKRGMIAPHVRSVVESLQIDLERWLKVVTRPARLFGTSIGSSVSLAIEAARRGLTRVVGVLDVCLMR